MKKLISIITPCYNEEENLRCYYKTVSEVIKPLEGEYDFEIIITDNCSTDRTWDIITELSTKDKRIRAFRFCRNFGLYKSILTGYKKSRGDASFYTDCDLQDPTNMMPEMLKKWEEGYKIVYGARNKRKEGYGFLMHFCKKLFYGILDSLSVNNIPRDAGDFCVLDRKVINYLCKTKIKTPYIRGIIFSSGYNYIDLPYNRKPRTKGESKFNIWRLLNLSLDAFANQSILPLRIAGIFGIILTFLFAILSVFFIINKLLGFIAVPNGLTTIILFLMFGFGMTFVFLGVIGEYVGRIYSHLISSDDLTIIEDYIDNAS
jgi:glycosyltransferase involved in cell wall biosynthesis